MAATILQTNDHMRSDFREVRQGLDDMEYGKNALQVALQTHDIDPIITYAFSLGELAGIMRCAATLSRAAKEHLSGNNPPR